MNRMPFVGNVVFTLACASTSITQAGLEAPAAAQQCPEVVSSPFPAVHVPAENEWSAECEQGDASACRALAAHYWYAEPRRRDRGEALYRRAIDLFEGLCAAGQVEDCDELESLLRATPEGIRDPARARRVWVKAAQLREALCNNGDAGVCHDLGHIYKQVGRDGEAFNLHRRACDGGLAKACDFLGLYFHTGTMGAPRNDPQALSYFARACELGGASGCARAAIVLRRGDQGVRDPDRAAKLFERACAADQFKACYELGLMKMRGDGIEADRADADRLLGLACAGCVEPACAAIREAAPRPQD